MEEFGYLSAYRYRSARLGYWQRILRTRGGKPSPVWKCGNYSALAIVGERGCVFISYRRAYWGEDEATTRPIGISATAEAAMLLCDEYDKNYRFPDPKTNESPKREQTDSNRPTLPSRKPQVAERVA